MSRVLLINPLIREWAKPNVFPTGLGYIAAVLKKEGHEVMVLDLNARRDLSIDQLYLSSLIGDGITPYNPDLIGIGGIITQYGEVKRIAAICRRILPQIPIVCGGPLATTVPELLIGNTQVDITVSGEGERAVKYLMSLLSEPLSLSGHLGMMSPIVDLDTNPYPAYALFPMDIYLNNPIAADNRDKWNEGEWKQETIQRKSMNMIGTRGCIFHCIFCHHGFQDQGYRMRNPIEVVKEMKFLGQKYGVTYIHFTDDAFACNRKFVEGFCLEMLDQMSHSDYRWDISWSCAGRANIMTEALVDQMRWAGCEGICYGLESGSQRMLDVMNKKITVDQYRRAIALNKGNFTYEDYTFIVGTPGETWDTVKESVQFCKDEGIVPSAVFYMTPYPGTPLFKKLCLSSKKFAIIYEDKVKFEEFILRLGEQGEQMVWNCSGRPDEEVKEWHRYFLEETKAWNRKKHLTKAN